MKSAAARLLLLAFLLGGIAYFASRPELLKPAHLDRELERVGRLAPLLFILTYAVATVFFLPGSVLTLAGGALFGPIWGTLWNLIGATAGAVLAFIIARYIARDWVARRAGERLRRVMRGVDENGWRFVALVRLTPLFPFNLVNYAFGLTPIPLNVYAFTSFVCMAPGALAYTYLGYAGRQAASGQTAAIRTALIALALLAVVAFLPRFIGLLIGPRRINPEALRSGLEAGERIALIDVRTADEFNGPLGHITGAINIPVAELESRSGELAGFKGGPTITI